MSHAENTPTWKRLFTSDRFAWSFKMRPGDARTFFAPQDSSGQLLKEKRHALETHPDRYIKARPEAGSLINAVIDAAIRWNHIPANEEKSLLRLAREWEPDVLIMSSDSMAFVAGCVCMPSSWSLEHTVGKSIHDVHEIVPRLNPSIGKHIERFLKHIQPGKAFRRENWSIARTDDQNYHPAMDRPRLNTDVHLDALFLRIEQQLFTAIPGGVLMGVRIENFPLTDLKSDPEVWNNLANMIRTMPDDVADYKSMLDARDHIAAEMLR